MATFSIVVLEHHLKKDGTYPVKIRVTHNHHHKYLKTSYNVKRTQLNNDFGIVDNYVLRALGRTLDEYRKRLTEIINLEDFSIEDLVSYLAKPKEEEINFFEFGETRIAAKIAQKEEKTAATYQTVINSLKQFTGLDNLPINRITAKFLQEYENWLLNKKIGKTSERKVTASGVASYMRTIRSIFNAAIEEYNDEDLEDIRIKHYPFKKFKIRETPQKEKKSLEVDVIRKIRDGVFRNKRENQARDIFMISFYLVGMNTKDIYSLRVPNKDIITYNRAKTDSRRKDGALMKIRVEPELAVLMEKYKGSGAMAFNFNRYATHAEFTRAANTGLKEIGKALGLTKSLTTYYARYSWATIARNECNIPTDDIALALNHSDQKNKVTLGYIETDFSKVWKANRKVLDLLNTVENLSADQGLPAKEQS